MFFLSALDGMDKAKKTSHTTVPLNQIQTKGLVAQDGWVAKSEVWVA
jgi:hypothetical protein